MVSVRALTTVALLAVMATGCSSTRKEDQLLSELTDMSKDEIFAKAEALYADGKVDQSRDYFSFVYDTFPNDPIGHKAALRVADTYAGKKDTASRTEARLRYRDFANRYPNDPDRDYALLMVGNTYSGKKMKPDRDLTMVREALDAYKQLLALYPDSEYYDQAAGRIQDLTDVLAEHELITARFYARNKRWLAAIWRLQYLKENYPDYSDMGAVDALLADVRQKNEELQEEFREYMERRRQKAKEKHPEDLGQPADATAAAEDDGGQSP